MNRRAKIIIGISFLLALNSCRPDDDVSEIPELFFRDFSRNDSMVIWSIGFTDGDGDLGYRENSNDTNNFIVEGFTIVNGVETSFPPNTLNNYRIPVVENISTKNGIEGEFKITIELSSFKNRGYDTMRISGFVQDRAFNESNSVSTPPFRIN